MEKHKELPFLQLTELSREEQRRITGGTGNTGFHAEENDDEVEIFGYKVGQGGANSGSGMK
ncbi:hypothetical protein [Pedobacter nanyangensis]|uniref:hypothetical protein n=1 Tax=Pedobacter nanyangensis TaxID=1562389 RepID=UPI0013B3E669|nr:hypothetical protein [Pedobacter nanyangensis]